MSEHGGLVFFSFSSDQQHYFQRALQHRVASASAIFILLFFGALFYIFALGSRTLGWHFGFVLFYCCV